MPNPKYSQVYIRYLKARLLVVLKPRVWLTGIFLLVLMLIMRELWFKSKPIIQIVNDKVNDKIDKIEEKGFSIFRKADSKDRENNSKDAAISKPINEEMNFSDEERAIAADIDNLPSLLSDVEEAANILAINTTVPNNSKNRKRKPKQNQENFLEDIINQRSTTNQQKLSETSVATNNSNIPLIVNNPFLQQANTLLNYNDDTVNNQGLPVNSLNSLNTSVKPELEDDNSWVRNLNYHHNVNHNQQSVINPLEAAIKNSLPTQPINRNSADVNSQMGYSQSNNNSSLTNIRDVNGLQMPQNSGVNIPANQVSNTPMYNVPNNPNLPQPINQNQGVVNSTTPYLPIPSGVGNSNSYNYNQLPNSSQLPNSNQLLNSNQLQNSNVYTNPVQGANSVNGYQR
ncbi:MAG: hypothetical protein EAZ87_21225 [Nostocales cyanobacterium]|nr:MAG: hypothetical protein EAZ87_21225 [Nostocales cyanobacterium]